jgi:hypothetical protein
MRSTASKAIATQQLRTITLMTLLIASIFATLLTTDAFADRPNRNEGTSPVQEDERVQQSSTGGSQLEAAELRGGMRFRILVNEFVDNSNYYYRHRSGAYSITRAWQEELVHALNSDGRFMAIAGRDDRVNAREEQEFQASDWANKTKTVAEMGRMTGANLIARGEVVSIRESNNIAGRLGSVLGASSKGYEVTMIIHLTDAQTGVVLASERLTGKSRKNGLSLPRLPGGISLALDSNPNLEKAAADALKQAVEVCARQLDQVTWVGLVIKVKAEDNIAINRGSREGVSVGQVFEVGYAESLFDETGELLDYSMDSVGKLQVFNVREKIAYCRVVSGNGAAVKESMNIWIP